MSIEQDTYVALSKTPVSSLEDATLKTTEAFREGIHYWESLNERYQSQISARAILKLARTWGVCEEDVRRLETGFDKSTYTFPMRNWQGEIVGIRKRSYKDVHSKYAVKDSTLGLFIPKGVTPGNLQIVNESESDVAAALSTSFQAIGVPSAGAAVDDVIGFVGQSPVACPCILGDNDPAGIGGADALAKGLSEAGIPCRILIPPESYADLRDWNNRGNLTSDELAKAITDQKVLYPEKWPSNFFMTPNALIRFGVISQVGTAAYAILAAIASFCDSNGVCRASRDRLSELTGLDTRTIDRCKRILKTAGLLSWKPGHKNWANEYRINWGPCKGSKRKYPVRPSQGEKKK